METFPIWAPALPEKQLQKARISAEGLSPDSIAGFRAVRHDAVMCDGFLRTRYRIWAGCIFLLALGLFPASSGNAATSADEIKKRTREQFVFEEVTSETMDTQALTEKGRRCLDSGLVNWQHAQTAHFTVHYERKDFARHVGRLAEFLYAYMADELGVGEERISGRSHIFVFQSARRWEAFAATISGPGEWAFSFVYGPDMFLQRAGGRHDSSEVLAHEMVHVILNRFYGRSPPLWLNEGLAQWYEEFGYAAFKGTAKSKKAPFRPLKNRYPLFELTALNEYPATREEVDLFYVTSKYLVGFFMLEYPPEKMNELVNALTSGDTLDDALLTIYSIGDRKYLERDFKSFAR